MRPRTEELKEAFVTKGYAVVSDAVPIDLAQRCRQLYLNAPFERQDQVRPEHYSHVFATEDQRLPREDEPYLAKFYRSIDAEKSDIIHELVDGHLKTLVEQISGIVCDKGFDGRAIKLERGDYIRFHVDNYHAAVGFIFYMSERWEWDWGGILQVAADPSSDVSGLMPRFNQLVVIDHGRRMPHAISTVAEYAMEPRLALAGFFR